MCCNSVEELRVSHDWLCVLNVFKHCSMMLSIPEDQISAFLFTVICCWDLESYYQVISQFYCAIS